VGEFKTKLFFLNDLVIGVATEVGPRILCLAKAEKPDLNLFGIIPEISIKTKDGVWKLFGGHRLWTSPEADPRSYSMDNQPVKISTTKTSILIQGNAEPENSVRKEIKIEPLPGKGVRVTHKITNTGRWPIELACWALSVMKLSCR